MHIKKHITVILAAFFTTVAATAQAPAEMLDYLKKNIRVWVLHETNVDEPSFYRVRPEGIFLDTDGIIMGKSSNNGMDATAQLLCALFKDPEKRNAGDAALQYAVYMALQLADKPIDLRFINDVRNTIDPEYFDRYRFYTFHTDDGRYVVYPGAFKSTTDTSAGDVVLGEALYSSPSGFVGFKRQLVAQITRVCLRDYGYTGYYKVAQVSNTPPPEKMYKRETISYGFPYNDIRSSIPVGIALSFGLEISDKDVRVKEFFNDWLGNGPHIIVALKGVKGQVAGMLDDVPAEQTLAYNIRKNYSRMIDTGYFLTSPPFPAEAAGNSWKIHQLLTLPNNLLIENDLVLGLILHLYTQKNFLATLTESLKVYNAKTLNIVPAKKFPVLIQTLCTAGLGDGPISAVTNDNGHDYMYLFPLALIDLFLDFPAEGSMATNLSKLDETFFGLFPAGTFSRDILVKYFSLRPQLNDIARNANKKGDMGLINTGYVNVMTMVDAIWKFLRRE